MSAFQIQYLIISLVVFDFVFNKFISYLNNKNWQSSVPKEMIDVLDEEKYLSAADYHKANGKAGLVSSGLSFIITILAISYGWFGSIEVWAKSINHGLFIQTSLFFGVIIVASSIISLPFSIYQTFKIEADFGFNNSTLKTFAFDMMKSLMLTIVVGGGLLWLVLWIYEYFESGYWVWLWLLISVFVVLTNMFYADVILPIFNKLKPLEDGELKNEIRVYTDKIGYPIKNIYVIDGSKRSTKANAFFSGIGPRKTIALFDTLIEKNSTEELVAILAHEVGHYKRKHIIMSLFLSLVQIGITLFLLEQFISIPEFSMALGGEVVSFAIGLIAFGFVFSPVGLIIGIFMNVLSRKNEFEADEFAKETYKAEPLINGLKKLSVDSLSNLHPHPWHVFIHYSHPPLLKRIKALRN